MKYLSYHQGHLTLKRPDKLNCLHSDLIQEMHQALDLALADQTVKTVILTGEGKAFCAGGDVVELVQNLKSSELKGTDFFALEYQLDYRLATLSKPLFVFGHGAVMGGGLGLYQGASKRILDPKAMLAMPEIAIGLFPDVGATYFLNQLPKFWGMLLGLTGMRVSGGVAKLLGFADHLIEQEDWSSIIEKAQKGGTIDWPSYEKVPTQDERTFKQVIETELARGLDWSDLNSFDSFARNYQGYAPLEAAFKQYLHGSPSSAAVIHHQLLSGRNFDLKTAYDQDLVLAKNFLKKKDFFEGVRALLIDKDKKPIWNPSSLQEIKKTEILSYFTA
jgi:enoyl-CoA hydratase/carnithine racemase